MFRLRPPLMSADLADCRWLDYFVGSFPWPWSALLGYGELYYPDREISDPSIQGNYRAASLCVSDYFPTNDGQITLGKHYESMDHLYVCREDRAKVVKYLRSCGIAWKSERALLS